MTMARIFISYRRTDSSGVAGRLNDCIRNNVKSGDTFLDVQTILYGDNFESAIVKALDGCELFFAVIGPDWMGKTTAGGRRLDDSGDLVRAEIRAALARGVRVVPLLLDGAIMPRAEDLPEDIRGLAQKHAAEVRHQSFDRDMAHLFQSLGFSVGASEIPRTDEARWVWLPNVAKVVGILFVAAGLLAFSFGVVESIRSLVGVPYPETWAGIIMYCATIFAICCFVSFFALAAVLLLFE